MNMNLSKKAILTLSAVGLLSWCNPNVIKTYENTNWQLTQITVDEPPIIECHPALKKSMQKCNEA